MTKDEALKLALQLISNLRTHSWTVADEQLVITAIKEALAQPETLPWTNKMSIDVPNQPLYTAPQRKPLSDEEILTYNYMIDWTAEWSYINFARAIEAAHGIKGEA